MNKNNETTIKYTIIVIQLCSTEQLYTIISNSLGTMNLRHTVTILRTTLFFVSFLFLIFSIYTVWKKMKMRSERRKEKKN